MSGDGDAELMDFTTVSHGLLLPCLRTLEVKGSYTEFVTLSFGGVGSSRGSVDFQAVCLRWIIDPQRLDNCSYFEE
jgi:hypothetical protein